MEEPTLIGIDLGDPTGDCTAVVYVIPPGAEAEFRAFFGGALPEWVQVVQQLQRIVEPPSLRRLLPAPGRRTAQWKREGEAGRRWRTR